MERKRERDRMKEKKRTRDERSSIYLFPTQVPTTTRGGSVQIMELRTPSVGRDPRT